MRKANVKLKNKHGEDVIYTEIDTISLDGEDGRKKTFSLGTMAEENISLDFSNGNQIVTAPEDKLYTKITILKPDTFKAENIAEGVEIAGIIGTFEGMKELPTLYTPSLSRSKDTVTINNPSSNGSFNKGFNIYSGEELVFSQTSTTFSIIGKFEAEKDYTITATCINPLMNESAKSNKLSFAVYSVVKDFDEFLSTTDKTTKISNGITYSLQINRAFGYWLPELIKVYKKQNGSDKYNLTSDYTYSMYTGEISLPEMEANIKIEAKADEEPILKRVELGLNEDEFVLSSTFPRYSERLLLYDGDELFHTEERPVDPTTVTIEKIGSNYTFTEDADGYYKPTNRGVHGSFGICRIRIVNKEADKEIKMYWMQSSEQSYDYGMVGKLDTALSLSSSVDSNLLFNAYGRSATSPQILSLEAPSGEHFYDVKYRKDGSVNSGWDMFEFRLDVNESVASIKTDDIKVAEDYFLHLSNKDYEYKTSANVTHHIYADDILIAEIKEGI